MQTKSIRHFARSLAAFSCVAAVCLAQVRPLAGTGCSVAHTPPTLSFSPPLAPSTLRIRVTNAAPSGLGFILADVSGHVSGIGGCPLRVGSAPPVSMICLPDTAGIAVLSLSFSNPAIIGLSVDCQGVFLANSGPILGVAEATAATRLTFQASYPADRLTACGVVQDSTWFGYGGLREPHSFYDNNQFHCIATGLDPVQLDTVFLHMWSEDGRIWTPPSVAMRTGSFATAESTIRFQGLYYVFYTTGFSIFCARAPVPSGPYLTLTSRGTWEAGPADPRPIVTSPYVVLDVQAVALNGVTYLWHKGGLNQVMTSTDLVSWSPPTALIDLATGSSFGAGDDVKWDASRFAFVAHGSSSSGLWRCLSVDGVQWADEGVVGPAIAGGNVSLSGSSEGHLLNARALVLSSAGPALAQSIHATAWNPAGATWNVVHWGEKLGLPLGIQSTIPAIGDYDGDGCDDACYVDNLDGTWFIKESSGIPGSGGFPSYWNWPGTAGSRVAIGDYDGDTRTDRAIVVNQPVASWYVIGSHPSGSTGVPWGWQWPGTEGASIVPGDYDGDGRTDRCSIVNNNWFCITTSGQSGFAWGAAWGIPGTIGYYSGDFDADGRSDRLGITSAPAYYVRLHNGSQGVPGIPWGDGWPGTGGGSVGLGDFDNDGRIDRAICNAADGRWYVRLTGCSGCGLAWLPWGWPTPGWNPNMTPAIGDFDGDGASDAALLDRATGRFLIKSSSGFHIYQ